MISVNEAAATITPVGVDAIGATYFTGELEVPCCPCCGAAAAASRVCAACRHEQHEAAELTRRKGARRLDAPLVRRLASAWPAHGGRGASFGGVA